MAIKLYDFDCNPYFDSYEFDSSDIPDSGKYIDIDFITRLTYARYLSGIPYIIISGNRSIKHNKLVGGVSDSSHLIFMAADIKYSNSRECYKILTGLLKAGFNRIGINNGTIHADSDNTKPQEVIWNYYNGVT